VSARRQRRWPLPAFDRIGIKYTTDDRYGDPYVEDDERYAQWIRGEVQGLMDDDPEDKATVLGWVNLVRINLWETGDEELLLTVLDHHGDWVDFAGVMIDLADDVIEAPVGTVESLLILDRIQLVRDARGFGLGLHVLARATLTWTGQNDLVVVRASAFAEKDKQKKAALSKRLARTYEKLGLDHYAKDEGILYGFTVGNRVWPACTALADEWECPEPKDHVP
jgi:hypothetical protein